jgi:hypothetical protein
MTNQPCDEKQLTLYYYNELEGESRLQIENHLKNCADCRSTLEQIKTCLEAIPKYEQELDSASQLRFTEKVLAKTGSRHRLKPVWGGSLAAAGALMLALSLMPGDKQQPAEIQNPILTELEMLEQFELLQNFDLLQNLELLEELGNLG